MISAGEPTALFENIALVAGRVLVIREHGVEHITGGHFPDFLLGILIVVRMTKYAP